MVNYDRIWELCKETGKKRSYLSKAMGHSERYLLDARKQNTNIKPDELAILASELNTTPEYLTGETDEPGVKKEQPTVSDGLPKSVIELLGVVATLSEEEAASLLAFLKANRKPK